MIRTTLFVLANALLAPIAAAHPGHGDPERGAGLLHHATEPEHVVAALVAVAAIAVLVGLRGRARRTSS